MRGVRSPCETGAPQPWYRATTQIALGLGCSREDRRRRANLHPETHRCPLGPLATLCDPLLIRQQAVHVQLSGRAAVPQRIVATPRADIHLSIRHGGYGELHRISSCVPSPSTRSLRAIPQFRRNIARIERVQYCRPRRARAVIAGPVLARINRPHDAIRGGRRSGNRWRRSRKSKLWTRAGRRGIELAAGVIKRKAFPVHFATTIAIGAKEIHGVIPEARCRERISDRK